MKKLILLLSFVISTSLWAAGPAEYSEAADIFELMDNVSLWHSESRPSYFQAFQEKSELSDNDKAMLQTYKDLRLKYYKSAGLDKEENIVNDAFGRMPFGYDIFSASFYKAKSVREALINLKKYGVSDEDISTLKDFYEHFKLKIESFTKESNQFVVKLLAFNKMWRSSGSEKALKMTSGFVLGKLQKNFKFKMLFVWSPDKVLPSAEIRGPFVILRYNPITQMDNFDMTGALEKAVMAVIHAQPETQRENLTKIFKNKCNGRDIELQETLPLLFGKMLPEQIRDRKKFDLYQRWSSKVFVDVYAKVLYPLMMEHIKKKGTFQGTFMEESASLCRQLHRLSVAP